MPKYQVNKCEYCGIRFLTRYPTQKYCSKGCRIDARNSREEAYNHLCWRCKNSCGTCSWSRSLIPVKGWKAEPSIVRNCGVNFNTYSIKECPQFIFE